MRNQNRHQQSMPMQDRSNNRATQLSGRSPQQRPQYGQDRYSSDQGYRDQSQSYGARDNQRYGQQNYSQSYGQDRHSEPTSFDANYGSNRWGSGRRDQYDATRVRDENYDNSSSYGYDRERSAGREEPQFRERHAMNHANSYNDEYDHDYENRGRHSQKEDRWSQQGPQDRQSRGSNRYDYDSSQPQRQGRYYADRADQDQERYESDGTHDQYRGNQRNRDYYY